MKKYLITSPHYYTNSLEVFKSKLSKQLRVHNPDYVLYRDKSNLEYSNLAKEFVNICKSSKNTKSFVHQEITLAKTLGASGVHLTSLQFHEIKKAKDLGLEVIISTHTHEEVLKAQKLGADSVTYSPIFVSPNKGKAKGIDDLKKLINKCDIKIFALGGIIDIEQIKLIKASGVYGFASIRYFYDDYKHL